MCNDFEILNEFEMDKKQEKSYKDGADKAAG